MAKRIFTLINRIALLATQQGGYASKQELAAALATASQQAFNALFPAKAAHAMGPQLNREAATRLSSFYRQLPIASAPITLPADCAYVDYYAISGAVTVEEVNGAALLYRLADPNCGPTAKYPIIGEEPGGIKQVYPTTITGLILYYYARPTEPVYFESYTSGTAVYDDAQSVDTGWSIEREPELIVRTLRLLGLEIRDPQLSAVAAQLTQEAL